MRSHQQVVTGNQTCPGNADRVLADDGIYEHLLIDDGMSYDGLLP
jgi:hypothetical protein